MLDGCTLKLKTDAKLHNSLGLDAFLGHSMACGVYQVAVHYNEKIQMLLICFDFEFDLDLFDGRRYCHKRFIV